MAWRYNRLGCCLWQRESQWRPGYGQCYTPSMPPREARCVDLAGVESYRVKEAAEKKGEERALVLMVL